MKIKFYQRNLKVLVTRISGKFNIYSETNKKWDPKLTKGSFRVNDDVLYDKILEKITEIKEIKWYQYHNCNDIWEYDYTSCLKSFFYREGFLIFTVKNGVITDVEVGNHKEKINYYNNSYFHIIEFSSYLSFNVKNLDELPQNVIDKMKEVDDSDSNGRNNNKA